MSNSISKSALLIVAMIASLGAGMWLYQYNQVDFETLDGGQYRWADLRGEWVIINYFAPWCTPCLREMPELHHLNKSLPPNTRLFAINYDVLSLDELGAMTEKFEITLNVIVAKEDINLPIKRPPYLPATYIIGPEGDVESTIMGEVTAELLTQKIAQLQAR